MNAVRSRLARRIATALLGTLATAGALACGHCVEDRIAAVYDHALSQSVAASGHQLAYFAWDGPGQRSEAVRLKIHALSEATAGVDRGSVRVAMDPTAIAVSFDPRRSSAEAVGTALRKQLGSLKLSLIPLQTSRASDR